MEPIRRDWLTNAEGGGQLTVVQWNCLADWASYAFPKVDPVYLDWSYRKPRIIAECLRTNPDILCLQEVDHFEELAEAFAPAYEGLFKAKGKDGNPGRDGAAIFWRRDTLSAGPLDGVHFSDICAAPTMGQIFMCLPLDFRHADGTISHLRVVSTHLKAKADCEPVRTDQCKALANYLNSIEDDVDLLLVCGDFNTTDDSPGIRSLLETTRKFDLQSVYRSVRKSFLNEDSEPDWTTWKIREKVKKCTIDFIFSNRSSNWKPVDVLKMPANESIDSEQGLPSVNFPSDHCSMVATFQRT